MIITVNGDEIEHVLEGERTVGEVVEPLGLWLEERGLLIGGLSIDEQKVLLGEEDWKDRPVDSVDYVTISAVSFSQGRMSQLETVRDFFLLLQNAAEKRDKSSIAELAAGFPDLLRILPHLLDETSSPLFTRQVADSLAAGGFPPDGAPGTSSTGLPHTDGSAGRAEASVDNWSTLRTTAAAAARELELRRREIESPMDEALSASKSLADMAENLDEVAVNLQTGEQQAAMMIIIGLTELLQKFIRSLSWLKHPEGAGISRDLNGVLIELEGAIQSNDTVLTGDLLEYEIKPRLLLLPERISMGGLDS